jgi:hypothetical protein
LYGISPHRLVPAAGGRFGHYPGSTSDWDAVYFHVGVLTLAGRLTPAATLPKDAHLLGWGHLFAAPPRRNKVGRQLGEK